MRVKLFLLFWCALLERTDCRSYVSIRELISYALRLTNEKSVVDDGSKHVEPQDLLVIGAGYGRTGTASLVEALKLLGLSSYHMKSGVLDRRGHLELWYQHALERLSETEETMSFTTITERLRHDGFNATADVPGSLYFEELMEQYPKAKVVLTVRGGQNGAEAWARSMLQTVGSLTQLCRRMPYRWLPFAIKFCTLVRLVRKLQNVTLDDTTNLPHPEDLVRSYNNWIDHVQSKVPQERLLVFAPTDGWEPLCEFLSPVHITVAERCSEVLSSKQPYPRVNDTTSLRRAILFLECMALVCELSPFLLTGLVVFALFSWTRRKHSNVIQKSKID